MPKLSKKIIRKSYAVELAYKEGKQRLAWAFVYIIFQNRHKEPYALLENVYVEPELRNAGLGGKLVKLAIQEAKKRGCYKIIGTSKACNVGAHRFYERFGFKNIGFEFRMDLKKTKILTRD